MRETIAYKKNFITGEEEQSVKMKPDDTSIRGITTIQLFDEGGKILEEVKMENVITENVKKMIFEEMFYVKIKGENNKVYSCHAPFQVLFLTDYNGEEDSNIANIPGSVVGWADKQKPYSGPDGQRGTINQAESNFSGVDEEGNRILHFVFDFPTHSANGDIRTVCWASRLYPIIVNQGGIYLKKDNQRVNLFNEFQAYDSTPVNYLRLAVAPDNGDFVVYGTVGEYTDIRWVAVFDGKTREFKYYKSLRGELSSKITSAFGLGVGVDCVYLLQNTTSGVEVNYITGVEKTITLNAHPFIGSSNIYSLKIYVHPNGADVMGLCNGYYVCRGVKTGNNIIWSPNPIMYSPTSSYTYNINYNGVFFGNIFRFSTLLGLYDYDLSTGSLTKYEVSSYPASDVFMYPRDFLSYSIRGGRNDNTYIMNGRDTRTLGAINKLPSVIKKTSVNTMKVQYDFVVAPVDFIQDNSNSNTVPS